MEHTHREHEFEIVIERRPVIYYMVSVINGYNGVRMVCTTPVCMIVDDGDDAFRSEELVDGETVLNTVAAQPGCFEMGYWSDENGWQVVGYNIPGIPEEDWMEKAIYNEKSWARARNNELDRRGL